MRAGQPVSVTLDTRPGVNLAAHVDSLQRGSGARFSLLPPENATGNYVKVVQRVPVKIVFDDPQQVEQYALGPGMSVVPTVKVNEPGRPSAEAARVVISR
jgi:membrane fusion protein (multidrug efflux system)